VKPHDQPFADLHKYGSPETRQAEAVERIATSLERIAALMAHIARGYRQPAPRIEDTQS
jgi:hypothetical protein